MVNGEVHFVIVVRRLFTLDQQKPELPGVAGKRQIVHCHGVRVVPTRPRRFRRETVAQCLARFNDGRALFNRAVGDVADCKPVPKKRNASATAASPSSPSAAAKKSAARTRRTRSSKRNRSKLASPAAIDSALTLAFAEATTVAPSRSSKRIAKSPASSAAPRPSARTAKTSAPAVASSSSARAAKSSAPAAASSSPASAPAAAITAQPISTTPPPRIRIGDAMRRSGLDEYKVARTFAGVVDKLSDGNKDTGGVQKLLVDVLKECSRHLDPPQSERAAPAVPAHITMLHLVPRPVRTQAPPQQLNPAPSATPASESAASPASPQSSALADPSSL